MDPTLAAQMSEAVAEKVLRYRRDTAGWKICREGVSEELGGKGSRRPLRGARVPRSPQAIPLPVVFCTPLPWTRLRGIPMGIVLKKDWACYAYNDLRWYLVPFTQ